MIYAKLSNGDTCVFSGNEQEARSLYPHGTEFSDKPFPLSEVAQIAAESKPTSKRKTAQHDE